MTRLLGRSIAALVALGIIAELMSTVSLRSLMVSTTDPVHMRVQPRGRIPLLDLVQTDPEQSCPNPLVLINDTLGSASIKQRRIPRIIHVTSKSRCMTHHFVDTLNAWRNLTNHTLLLHNDAAVDRLLFRSWPEFPQLQKALNCMISGAAKADLWRALVLWEYGGMYTDVDNVPGVLFNSSTIHDDDQGFFVVERNKVLSQYFMAVEPRHPLMYLLVQAILHRLYDTPDVEHQYIPFVTGPGALKSAFRQFMNTQSLGRPGDTTTVNDYDVFLKVRAGVYRGLGNATVRVVGGAMQTNDWIRRGVILNKQRAYKSMNMTHFDSMERQASNESCLQKLYHLDEERDIDETELWWR